MNTLYFENENIKAVAVLMVEALNKIKDEVKAGYTGDIFELHENLFNNDYYIIGYYEAKEFLTINFDLFDVISSITEYEKDIYNEIYTDISDPEKVATMFYYLIGEYCIQELNNNSGIINNEINDKHDALLVLNEIELMFDRLFEIVKS